MQVTSSNMPVHEQTEHNDIHNNKNNTTDGIMNLHAGILTCTNHATGQITTQDNKTRNGETSEEDKPCWTNTGPQVSKMRTDNSPTTT